MTMPISWYVKAKVFKSHSDTLMNNCLSHVKYSYFYEKFSILDWQIYLKWSFRRSKVAFVAKMHKAAEKFCKISFIKKYLHKLSGKLQHLKLKKSDE